MLYFAEGLSHRNVCGLCCQAGAGTGLSRAFPLSPEFIVIHNGIITNYKDLRKFLVSGPWGLRPSLLSHSPLLSHPSWLTPPLVFSLSLSHLHSPLVPFLHSHCSTHSSLISQSFPHSHSLPPPFVFPHSYFCTLTHIFTRTPSLTLTDSPTLWVHSHIYIPPSLPTSLPLPTLPTLTALLTPPNFHSLLIPHSFSH